jgi:hypothetical protein
MMTLTKVIIGLCGFLHIVLTGLQVSTYHYQSTLRRSWIEIDMHEGNLAYQSPAQSIHELTLVCIIGVSTFSQAQSSWESHEFLRMLN